MRFVKLQAAGNDFILFDCLHVPEREWPELAPRLCDRHKGIGSDGLLILVPGGTTAFRMRMFNPDGTEDFCGNGLRCVGRYLHESGLHTNSALWLETLSGKRLLRFEARDDGPPSIAVNMGIPQWEASAIPARAPADPVVGVPLRIGETDVVITSLSTGTAHTVVFCEALPDNALFLDVSPKLEKHPWFPERTSVLWCQVERFGQLRLRIWERGVGETLACGTGVCAAAAAARRHALAGETVWVTCPGGSFQVVWEGDEQWLHGPAEIVFAGEIAL